MSYPLPSNYDSQFSEPDGYDWAPGLGGYEPQPDDFDEVQEFGEDTL